MRSWLPRDHDGSFIELTWRQLSLEPHLVLKALYNILHYMEERMDDPDTDKHKGVTLFTLIPTANGFTPKSFKADTVSLYGLLKRYDVHFTTLSGEDGPPPSLPTDVTDFIAKADMWWALCIDIDKLQSRRADPHRWFDRAIVTTGKTVSAVMRCKGAPGLAKSPEYMETPDDIHYYNKIRPKLAQYRNLVAVDPGRRDPFHAFGLDGAHFGLTNKDWQAWPRTQPSTSAGGRSGRRRRSSSGRLCRPS